MTELFIARLIWIGRRPFRSSKLSCIYTYKHYIHTHHAGLARHWGLVHGDDAGGGPRPSTGAALPVRVLGGASQRGAW